MEQNMQFRSAGFGGFNRQDVLNYIEETTKEYNQKLDELRTQYEAAQAEREELRQALSESKNQEENLQNKVEELLQEKNALLTRVKKLEPLQAQVTLLHSRVEALTPDAEAYAGLRSQISDIELEARQRASEILAQAKQKPSGLIRRRCWRALPRTNPPGSGIYRPSMQEKRTWRLLSIVCLSWQSWGLVNTRCT